MALNPPSALQKLPLAKHQGEILQRIAEQRNLLLTAPTGTGKSSYLPWLLHNTPNQEGIPSRIAMLQPRRIAALSLCTFLARCLGEEPGATVGYSFRFESRRSSATRIHFQTYGSFLQAALQDSSREIDWILFDEFHERRTEMDLLLTWCLAWQKRDPKAPRIAILSAELNRESLEQMLGIPCLRVESPGFPVQILNQEPKPAEAIDRQVLRAIRTLEGNQVWNTTLVFLPGKGEIQQCAQTLEDAFHNHRNPPEILKLFGGQELQEQVRIFADTEAPRVILATNIAETSLTVPQVTAVVDSGFERSTDFDVRKGIQTLKLGRIALQNAVQRTGRAGRTRPGVCIRLWSERDHQAMPREIIPEILRSPLQRPILVKGALAHLISAKPSELSWITPPDRTFEQEAISQLKSLGMLDEQGLATSLGLKALEVPVESLSVSRMLLLAPQLSPGILACATWIDAGNEVASPAGKQESRNLLELCQELLEKSRGIPREISMQHTKLTQWAQGDAKSRMTSLDADGLVRILLNQFPDSLATLSESGKAYRIGEDLTIQLDPAQTGNTPAALVFNLLRSGSRIQQISRCLFVPVRAELLTQGQKPEERWELLWRSGQERFTGLCVQSVAGKEIDRREFAPQDAPPPARKILSGLTVQAWAEKTAREDLSHHWMTDPLRTLLAKMKLAARNFPEYQLPAWSEEDWALVMDEFTAGVFLLRDLNEQRFRKVVEDYFGSGMLSWLHRTFPDTATLTSGRLARFTYPEEEDSPVEISARVADFFGCRGEYSIAESRIKVRYDLLAPNRRTVQKTWNLDGFWQNTYPEVRKELRGRYPRHPWPENPLVALPDAPYK